MATKKPKEGGKAVTPKENTAMIGLNITKIQDSIKEKCKENFAKQSGVDAKFDEIYEMTGFTKEFREAMPNMRKDIRDTPKIHILDVVVKSLKESTGTKKTERELMEEAQETLKAQTPAI